MPKQLNNEDVVDRRQFGFTEEITKNIFQKTDRERFTFSAKISKGKIGRDDWKKKKLAKIIAKIIILANHPSAKNPPAKILTNPTSSPTPRMGFGKPHTRILTE